MTKIISKSGMSRLWIFSFILLCCVHASENAYARPWKHDDMVITYDKVDKSFIIKFLIYDLYDLGYDVQSIVAYGDLSYSEDGKKYNTLIEFSNVKKDDDVEWSNICMKTTKGKLEFPNSVRVEKRDSKILVGTKITDSQRNEDGNLINSKTAYMTIKWKHSESIKCIRSFKWEGKWKINEKCENYYKIDEIYLKRQDKANSYAMLKATENNVKVFGGTDAIIVKGTVPGENIKVYSFSGVELKSVVAKDGVVNIDLPMNQNYIIKAGQKGYKVAL